MSEEAVFSKREAAFRDAALAFCKTVGGEMEYAVYAGTHLYFTMQSSNILYRVEYDSGSLHNPRTNTRVMTITECPPLSGGTLGHLFQQAVAEGAKQQALYDAANPVEAVNE